MDRTEAGLKAGEKYPDLITEAIKMRGWTYEKEVLQELTKLEQAKKARFETQLAPLVAQTSEMFEN